MTGDKKETEMVRVGKDLADYLRYIKERFREEYGINVALTEASNLLVGRAKDNKLF